MKGITLSLLVGKCGNKYNDLNLLIFPKIRSYLHYWQLVKLAYNDYDRHKRRHIMELGIFSNTYDGNLETVFKLINADGLTSTQFNLTTAGLETMPLVYNRYDLDEIIRLSAISGTFNMIDPDLDTRKDGIKRFRVLCEIANYLQIPIISLCTGSKNLKDKWAWDIRNLLDKSWEDLSRKNKTNC